MAFGWDADDDEMEMPHNIWSGPPLAAMCRPGPGWWPVKRAPRSLRGTLLAATKVMARDRDVPHGFSEHSVNGVRVRVRKDRNRTEIVTFLAHFSRR